MMNWRMLIAMLGLTSGMPRQLSGRYGRPTGSDLRNPADPVQAARIEAAAAKRSTRACKLHNIHARAGCNRAHLINYEFSDAGRLIGYEIPARLNPTYIAK